MTKYRVSVMVNPAEATFCAYGGHCIELALDRAAQYEWAHTVIVEHKHTDGTWRVVTSREGLAHGLGNETSGVPDVLVSDRDDRGLVYSQPNAG